MDFAQNFIEAYNAGRQLRRQQEQDAAAEEERKLRIQQLQHVLRGAKLEDKLKAFEFRTKGAEAQFDAMNGADSLRLRPDQLEGGILPAHAAMPVFAGPGSDSSVPPAAGDYARSIAPPKIAPVAFPGFEDSEFPEFNRPGYSRQPQSLQDLLDLLHQKKVAEATPIQQDPTRDLVNPANGAMIRSHTASPAPPRPLSLEQQLHDAMLRGDVAEERRLRNAMNARDADMGGSKPKAATAAATARALKAANDQVAALMFFAPNRPPDPQTIASARKAVEAAGGDWESAKLAAAQAVERARLTATKQRDGDLDSVPDAVGILDEFETVEHAQPGGAPARGPAPVVAGGGRTATLDDVRAVAKRLNISENEARIKLMGQGVKIVTK